jgi:hypothetical protein
MARSGSDERLAVALAAGHSAVDAAAQAGVSVRTAFRRLREPAFRKRVSAIRDEVRVRCVGQLVEAGTLAVQTLRTIMTDPLAAANVRVSAARAVLEQGSRLSDSVELAGRVAALETKKGAGDAEIDGPAD